ncbi:OsmC family protein [Rubeoparvulum massiliense]|uniref:OsmC family protein n=1 Tax=Rubeoparvulum massiliense TaxID=1631346 RepID=UPI00065E18C4|nr:OsmC family protein [Rubeoparvulum massiliense]
MDATITWKGQMAFESEVPSGQKVMMDSKPEFGGQNLGASPMELVLSGVGGCTGIDIVQVLTKMRLNIEHFDMEVKAERAEEHPKRFTKIHIHYRLQGADLPIEKVQRAVDLSRDKYCSVAHSLNAELTTSFEVNGVVVGERNL